MLANQNDRRSRTRPAARRPRALRSLALLGGAAALTLGLALGGCATGRPVDDLRADGDWHYERGEYQQAEPLYREIIDRYPGDWRGNLQLGLVALELGHFDEARTLLKKAGDLRPENDDVADARAEAMFQQGDREALFAFLHGRASERQTVRDWLRLGRYAMRSQDPDTARIAVETAIEIDDGVSVEPYIAAADLAEQLGDLDTEIRRTRQAWGIEPSDALAARLEALGQVPGPTVTLPPGR